MPGQDSSGLTWGTVREALFATARQWRSQQDSRTTKRIRNSYDRRAERRFLSQWSAAPLPDPSDEPLVSVIIPVYKRPSLVAEAIASVQAQTLSNWELIVVDDGSDDETPDVVARMAAQDARIKLVRSQHGGVCRARNLGAEHATGRYVAWLDSDNTWRPHYLRTMIAAMHGLGIHGAFCGLERFMNGRATYRVFDGTREHLLERNHVSLIVLVVTRELLNQVGGFDEDLERMVDYDLVLRISEATKLEYFPFIGASYAEDAQYERISNREPLSWMYAVKNKHLIDWPRLEAELGGRVPGRVSVVIPTFQDWAMTRGAVEAVLDQAGRNDVEVVVIDNGSRRAVSALTEPLALRDPRVTVHRQSLNLNFALGCNLGFAQTTGEYVVFLNNDTVVETDWLDPLISELSDRSVLGVQPLLAFGDGTVQCAGVVFPKRPGLPVHFLARHPVEDAVKLGRFRVKAVTGAALATRASDVVAVRGFDPLYRNGWEDVDLCLRLADLREGWFVVATDAEVRHFESKTPGRNRHNGDNRRLFLRRWAGRLPEGDDALWQRAGFEISHYLPDEIDRKRPDIPRIARPWATRPPRVVTEGLAEGLPALRWAIKTAAVAGPRGLAWGDVHFAHALAASLRKLGQDVVLDAREAHSRDTSYLDDVVLNLRGLEYLAPQPGAVNLLWIISHPELVSVEEIASYDAVFAASTKYAKTMSRQSGHDVLPLLQCTDPNRFHPDLAEPDTGYPVLFVGNSRNVSRPIVQWAAKAGVDLAVFGRMWAKFLDPRHIRGQFVPNDEVGALYRAAGVVLNDHWAEMRQEGFISNRVFDVAAVGGRMISDDIEGVDELFGGLVQTVRNQDELAAMLKRPVDEVFPDDQERRVIARRIHREHSFDVRARQLLDVAATLWKR